MAVIKCANCGTTVNAEAEGCPDCGADPRTGEGAVAGLAAVENCAGCGTSVDAGTERCPNCGADPRTGEGGAKPGDSPQIDFG
jgi:RNA polymerase subunit RPABC4/transcription elongation factor Spt4